MTIMLLGHWIEMRSINQAEGALKELAKLLPNDAVRVVGDQLETVDISALKDNDVVLVRPGARVPADGLVIHGASSVDESMLTGESRAVEKKINDKVIAGTVSEAGSLRVKVTGTGEKTTLAGIMRAEAGELEIRPRSTDVVELVRDVADAFQGQAVAKQHVLSTDLPDGLPCLETDPGRLRQIVGNLVSNAVKYTPRGGRILVRVTMKPEGPAADDWDLEITVSDNGAGIPANKLPTLFTEFTRLDPAAAEGAGIGLAISKRIAEALGGDIAVESVVGQGSTFSLRLRSVRADLALTR